VAQGFPSTQTRGAGEYLVMDCTGSQLYEYRLYIAVTHNLVSAYRVEPVGAVTPRI
jgi:hypothetical protein